jgi:hypothetical protein
MSFLFELVTLATVIRRVGMGGGDFVVGRILWYKFLLRVH